MQKEKRVDIFWDYETARVENGISGYHIAKALREIAEPYGLVRSFRAYLDTEHHHHPGPLALKREVHSSGISIVDCPSISRKDVVDNTMIVDMLTLVMDEDPSRTILVASGDPSLSYALAILRLRRFKVVLVYPTGTQQCLRMQSDESFSWHTRVLGRESDANGILFSASSSSSSSSNHSVGSYTSYATPPVNSMTPPARVRGDSRSNSPIPPSRHTAGSRARTMDRDPQRANEGHVANSTTLVSPSLRQPLIASPVPNSPSMPRVLTPIGATRNPSFPRGISESPSPRVRSRTVSGGWFFPPPPSFPLDPPPPNILTPVTGEAPGANVGSPASSGGFSIVHRPADSGETPGASQPIKPSFNHVLAPLEPTPGPPSTTSQVTPVIRPLRSSPVTATTMSTTIAPGNPLSTVPANPLAPALPRPGPSTPANNQSPIPPTKLESSPSTQNADSPPSVPPTTPPSTKRPPRPHPTSSTTQESSTHAESSSARPVPVKYRPLVRCLQTYSQNGGPIWVEQSQVASKIVKLYPKVYADAGVNKWKKYAVMAVDDGIILKTADYVKLGEAWLDSVVP